MSAYSNGIQQLPPRRYPIIAFHALLPVVAARLNRGKDGRNKRVRFGNEERFRISSQCQKFSFLRSNPDFNDAFDDKITLDIVVAIAQADDEKREEFFRRLLMTHNPSTVDALRTTVEKVSGLSADKLLAITNVNLFYAKEHKRAKKKEENERDGSAVRLLTPEQIDHVVDIIVAGEEFSEEAFENDFATTKRARSKRMALNGSTHFKDQRQTITPALVFRHSITINYATCDSDLVSRSGDMLPVAIRLGGLKKIDGTPLFATGDGTESTDARSAHIDRDNGSDVVTGTYLIHGTVDLETYITNRREAVPSGLTVQDSQDDWQKDVEEVIRYLFNGLTGPIGAGHGQYSNRVRIPFVMFEVVPSLDRVPNLDRMYLFEERVSGVKEAAKLLAGCERPSISDSYARIFTGCDASMTKVKDVVADAYDGASVFQLLADTSSDAFCAVTKAVSLAVESMRPCVLSMNSGEVT